ncbi:hydroxyacylglutathione hydrolase [Rhodanobacter sp. L36]|uniref:hydroxyacylglutathione hydrolase n=1 Tax=Rhodanobacter sp. L36 TaxID=1747221 RepID=UPI00131D2458|nr:hydroxyacylglutathione hydrolase [Rhodanobacter sp. L36]
MHVIPLSAFNDNYIWLLHDDDGNAVVVDPGMADVVERALISRHLTLQAILLTHHHDDHIGGVSDLLVHHSVPVYGPVDTRIPQTTMALKDGDTFALESPKVRFEILAIPGHTLSHVAYVGEGLLLCGDTMFSLGCGRLFEGTPAQMLTSLDRLAGLPDETLVCAGHEYTETNSRFALEVEPGNRELHRRAGEVSTLRAEHRPTLPVSLREELATNPFLRLDRDEVIQWCRRQGVGTDRVARFAALRAAKDVFNG